jgi:hypothetical protein
VWDCSSIGNHRRMGRNHKGVTLKHATMVSGPDLDRALAEMKERGIKVLTWERVGMQYYFKVMKPKEMENEDEGQQ